MYIYRFLEQIGDAQATDGQEPSWEAAEHYIQWFFHYMRT